MKKDLLLINRLTNQVELNLGQACIDINRYTDEVIQIIEKQRQSLLKEIEEKKADKLHRLHLAKRECMENMYMGHYEYNSKKVKFSTVEFLYVFNCFGCFIFNHL